MKREDNHRLLQEVLAGTELDSLRQRSLDQALAARKPNLRWKPGQEMTH